MQTCLRTIRVLTFLSYAAEGPSDTQFISFQALTLQVTLLPQIHFRTSLKLLWHILSLNMGP